MQIEERLASIKDGHRSNTLFNVKRAAGAVSCHPRRFGAEWSRRADWLLRLAVDQPAELGAEFAAILALAIKIRDQRK